MGALLIVTAMESAPASWWEGGSTGGGHPAVPEARGSPTRRKRPAYSVRPAHSHRDTLESLSQHPGSVVPRNTALKYTDFSRNATTGYTKARQDIILSELSTILENQITMETRLVASESPQQHTCVSLYRRCCVRSNSTFRHKRLTIPGESCLSTDILNYRFFYYKLLLCRVPCIL